MISDEQAALLAISVTCLVGGLTLGILSVGGISDQPEQKAEITLQNVTCSESGTCLVDADVDTPEDRTVVLSAPTPSPDEEYPNSSLSIDYYFSGDAEEDILTGHEDNPDIYAYELTEDGELMLVGAYDVTNAGDVEAVEPTDPPLLAEDDTE